MAIAEVDIGHARAPPCPRIGIHVAAVSILAVSLVERQARASTASWLLKRIAGIAIAIADADSISVQR